VTAPQRAVRHREGGSKQTNNIFAMLDLPPSEDGNRWMMAVLTYLSSR
jgi:hypothetical protein